MGIRTELGLRLPNSPGALAAVCRLLAEQRVRIIAMSLDAGGQCRKKRRGDVKRNRKKNKEKRSK